MRVIQERNAANNTPTVSYTRGNDLSGTMEGAGGIGGLLARSDGYSSGNFTNHSYYFADGNGNITYMLNSSESMVASYRYDPFGNTISSSGTLSTNNVYRFSSKEIHPNSGMYYYGYRFYDPNLQRWINRDPIWEMAALAIRQARPYTALDDFANAYIFVRNDAANEYDGDGMIPDGPFIPPPKGYDPHNWPPSPIPPIPKCVKDCSKKCFLATLPMRGVCLVGCIGAGPGYLGCVAACNLGATISQTACTAICIIGSLL
jgi:RHS repeat-associated protein